MNNEIDKDFEDINKESKAKTYVIVGILYIMVIILIILLVKHIENQKEVINSNEMVGLNYEETR